MSIEINLFPGGLQLGINIKTLQQLGCRVSFREKLVYLAKKVGLFVFVPKLPAGRVITHSAALFIGQL
jgi:hypothetical protein